MAKRRPAPANPWPDRLRALRERLGAKEGRKKVTQAEIATLLRISVRAYISWERGDQVPVPSHQLLIELLEAGKF